MRITVVGPGGVGGYLAARLAESTVADVSVLARGQHLDAIRRNGLRLESPLGDAHVQVAATHDPSEIGEVDAVLLAVKSTDVRQAVQHARPLVGRQTAIVTLQNGVDSPTVVTDTLGSGVVLPGVAYIFSTIAAPGVVRHTTGPATFVFGSPEPAGQDTARTVGAVLGQAGVTVEVVDDPMPALWSKFALICATAGLTATSRLPIGVLREDPAARWLFRELAGEVVRVAAAVGVALDGGTVDRTMAFIDGLGGGAYSSLLYDLVNGKTLELASLHGAVVRLADEFRMDAPSNRTVHATLSAWTSRPSSSGSSLLDLDGTLVLRGGGGEGR